MKPRRPLSAAGALGILIGGMFMASAVYRPFDPDFCEEGCGIGSGLEALMSLLNAVTGHWGPRVILFALGCFIIAKSLRLRVRRRGAPPGNPSTKG